MKFNVMREDLLAGLQLIGPAVSRRSTLPVLANVCLTAESDGLRLAATNLELLLGVQVDADVEEMGSVTLPHKLLVDIVTEMGASDGDDDRLRFTGSDLETTKPHVSVVTNISDVVLNGTNANEWPLMPTATTEASSIYVLDAMWLIESLSSVMMAAASDDSRPTLTTVKWSLSGGTSVMAATDGFRLALRERTWNSEAVDFDALFVVTSLAAVLQAIKVSGAEQVKMTLNCNVAWFEAGTMLATMRLPDLKYPDYEPIIPSTLATTLTASRKRMLAAARLAMVMARDDKQNNAVGLQVFTNTDDGATVLKMTARSSDLGENEAQCPAQLAGDRPEPIHVNGKYLKDALEHCPTDELVMGINAPAEPIVLQDGNGWRCVIMPVHKKR